MNPRAFLFSFLIAAAVMGALIWVDSRPQKLSVRQARPDENPSLLKVKPEEVQAAASGLVPQTATPGDDARAKAPASEALQVAKRERARQTFSSNFDWTGYFRKGEAVSERRLPADDTGRYTEIRVVRTDFKYPMIQIEEDYMPTGADGAPKRVATRAFVADHLVVELKPGRLPADLDRILAQSGLSVFKQLGPRGPFLVTVPDASASSVAQLKAKLQNEGSVSNVEPDYIAVPDF